MKTVIARLTLPQSVLLAADDLARQGKAEFTEWDLTVAAWKNDKNRFGMRGYEADFPDHHRISMEIHGGKATNPVRLRYLEKTRPNHYSVTLLGRAEAERLRSLQPNSEASVRSPGPAYVAVEKLVKDRVFLAFLSDPDEPRSWLGASAFLRLARSTPRELNERIRAAEGAARIAPEWCEQNGRESLTRGATGGGEVITVATLRKLADFLGVLQERFVRQIRAVRAKPE